MATYNHAVVHKQPNCVDRQVPKSWYSCQRDDLSVSLGNDPYGAHLYKFISTVCNSWLALHLLTYWGRVTHICVSKLTIISSDNGLSPGRRHAIIWTNAGILLSGPSGTNFIEILIEIQTFPFKQMHLKMSSWKGRPLCLGLNVLTMK